LGEARRGIFLETRLDCQHQIDPVQQITFNAQGGLVLLSHKVAAAEAENQIIEEIRILAGRAR
jgi:hypothetical protein